jgi:oligopeptide transport system permease protein
MLIKRIAANLLVLFLVIFLSLVLFRFLPGSAFDDEAFFHPEIVAKFVQPLQKQSLFEQGTSFLSSLFSKSGPPSLLNPDSSLYSIFASSWRATSALMGLGLLWTACLFSLLVLLSSVLRLKRFVETGVLFLSSISTLILAPLVVYLLVLKWSVVSPSVFLGESLLLPSLLLSYRPVCLLFRLYTTQLQSLQQSNFVQVLRAMGFSKRVIDDKFLWPHLIPTLRLASVQCVLNLFSGSILIETLFGLPGLGTELLKALSDRDVNIAVGFVLIISSVALFSYQLVQQLNRKTIGNYGH